jgi:hypothetical protein
LFCRARSRGGLRQKITRRLVTRFGAQQVECVRRMDPAAALGVRTSVGLANGVSRGVATGRVRYTSRNAGVPTRALVCFPSRG